MSNKRYMLIVINSNKNLNLFVFTVVFNVHFQYTRFNLSHAEMTTYSLELANIVDLVS